MHMHHQLKSHIKSTLFHQVKPLCVLSNHLEDVLLSVNRLPFLPPAKYSIAYADAPIILKRRCELPFFVLAFALEAFKIPDKKECRREALHATVISAGAGYTSTLLSKLCDYVEAFESDSVLFARLVDNTKSIKEIYPTTKLSDQKSDIILFDGGSYDHIPDFILKKIKPNGRLVMILKEKISQPFSLAPLSEHLEDELNPLCHLVIYHADALGNIPEKGQKILQIHIPQVG